MNEEIGIAKNKFEDNTSVFSWRYDNAKDITKKIRKAYRASKKITGFKLIKYENKKKSYFWNKKSWYYIEYQKYKLQIK